MEMMRALVLSAGGAFGAYQAGACRALEEAGWRPRIVAGTSAGALNAAAIARGASANDLQQAWRDRRDGVFRWMDPRPLAARIGELFQAHPRLDPQIRLLVTVTELPSTRIRVLADEEVTEEVLLASCAIPGVFPPVKIGGIWCCDGGIFSRSPVEAAMEAGAGEVLVIDPLGAAPSRLLRLAMNAAIGLRQILRGEKGAVAAPGVRIIAPSVPLGRLRDVLRWDAVLIDRWIELGYRDARQAVQEET